MIVNQTKIFLWVLLILSKNCFPQLSIKQLQDLKLGESYPSSKSQIANLFTEKPSIMKGDFLGASRIIFEKVPFSYYGNCNYCFQFVKDTLVSTKVEFNFYASDTLQFKRLLTSILSDFDNDNSKVLFRQYSNLVF
jgi:hypothetical protein